MTHPAHSFSSLPLESQIRILINAHNAMVEERRTLKYDKTSLTWEVDQLKKKISEGTEHELTKLKAICDLQTAKIGRQENRIKELERLMKLI